jgi:serine protease
MESTASAAMKVQRRTRFGLPVRPVVGDSDRSGKPSGMIVVRLTPEASQLIPEQATSSLASHAKAHKLERLKKALDAIGAPESYRLVRSVQPEKLIDMEREATRTKYPPLNSLTQYWRIDMRDRMPDEVLRAITLLEALPEVEAAYDEPLSTLPVVTATDDPHNATQDYQDAAPTGIDARWMWTQPSGEGAGVGIVDVEGGWRTTHEDLAGKAPTLIFGVQYAPWEDHGTAVLGEIVAVDNTVGVVGTAPAINSVRMSSIYDAGGVQHVTDALVAAIAAMTVGQILLIELQTNFLPVETLADRLDAIRLATARGIIVVEAAGNGNNNLDTWTSGGLQRLNRASPDFLDSGAIMVGACISAVPHDRWWASNFGSRIDCFAWGENVTSCGYGDLDAGGGNADLEYTDTFQGTSSASPIIVSAAALVQSRYQATTSTMLSPGQMRALLSNPATGTAQGAGVAGAIGVMPDLSAIIPTLGLLPDIYVRDAVGDTGSIPWSGAISSSPDVIVRPSPVADPQLAYGEGSGTEGSALLGHEVEAGQDNHIYVRVRNRGGAAATAVQATVYWSEVATLVTPSMWNLIGTVTIASVPVGDLLTVSPALLWDQTDIPATGHYCFVAMIGVPGDPAPPTPGVMSWTTFQDMIRNHNNVTWRNFNVVNALPDAPNSTPAFDFKITGAEDRAHRFEFEIERRLPPDAELILEGPYQLLAMLRGENQWKIERDPKSREGRLALPPLPRIRCAGLTLPRGARLSCRFRIRPRGERVVYGQGVAIRQIYKGQEVGRITWQFAPEACLCGEHNKERPR